MNELFCFGFGFSAKALSNILPAESWRISGTCRAPAAAAMLTGLGIDTYVFDGQSPVPDARAMLGNTTHLLISIPPGDSGDKVLAYHRAHIAVAAPHIKWIGYLSTIGVYGDHGGAWIDEDTAPDPVSGRAKARLAAEAEWLELGEKTGIPVHIFRLPGIYGPGRNALESVKAGKAHRIVRKGQLFNRIHVDDLGQVLAASMARPYPGRIYNVVDDEPAPPQDVVTYAAKLLNITPPPLIDFEKAEMSDMARSFYSECKKAGNERIKQELGIRLLYPDYRKGLLALYSDSISG